MFDFDFYDYDDDDDLLLLDQLPYGRFGGGALSPPLANLVLWLKADAITGLNDGDPIATWLDSSGSANDATQGTAANRPIYKVNIINGRPIARFDGLDDGMTTANAVFTANPLSFFVVYNSNAGGGAARRVIQGVLPTNFLIGPYAGSYQIFNGAFINDGAITLGAFKLSTYIHDGANASFWLNSVLIGSNANTNVPNTVALGLSNAFTETWQGDLAEVLGYNVDMTSQRTTVETYLNSKYALF